MSSIRVLKTSKQMLCRNRAQSFKVIPWLLSHGGNNNVQSFPSNMKFYFLLEEAWCLFPAKYSLQFQRYLQKIMPYNTLGVKGEKA